MNSQKCHHNGFPIVVNFDPEMVDAVGFESGEFENNLGYKPHKKLKRFG